MAFERIEAKFRKAGSRLSASGFGFSQRSRSPSASSSRPGTKTIGPVDDTLERSDLQTRLWNSAYDKLEDEEPKTVEAYEKILLAQYGCETFASFKHEETRSSGVRSEQMVHLVRIGLERTKKEASVKLKINAGLEIIEPIRKMVGDALQAVPQAAVAWTGVCLGLEILSSPMKESKANREGMIHVLTWMKWYWNLTTSLLERNRAEGSSSALKSGLESQISLLYQKLLLYQMNSVCLYFRNKAVAILRDVLRLDGWEDQLNGIKAAEAVVQSCISQYSTEEIRSLLNRLVGTAISQDKKLLDICSAIQSQTQQQDKSRRDEKAEQCLRDLRVTDPRDDKKRIQESKGGIIKDSYSWILSHGDFQEWRENPQNQLLWIKGDPGKGKTMLLCGIIDELGQSANATLSYFFCQATDTRLNKANAVLRGLIYLLVEQHSSLISHVQERYAHAGKSLFEDVNSWTTLSGMLTDICSNPATQDTILIVDALDECETEREELLELIAKTSGVKWIVSSRNWPEIEEKLQVAEHKIKLSLELNKASVSLAVKNYIKVKVDRLAHDKKYDAQLATKVREHFTSNAEDTFLWVALVYQELTKIRSWETEEELRLLPPGLDSLYSRMVKKIEQQRRPEILKDALAAVLTAYRPLALTELQLYLNASTTLGIDDLEDIVNNCGAFLTIRDGIVYFVHQSAKDYLLETKFVLDPVSGEAHQHYSMFSRSLEGLLKTLRRDMFDLGEAGFAMEDIPIPDPDPLASLRYSCVYWVDHLHDSGVPGIPQCKDLQDDSPIHALFQEKYLNWLEALGLHGETHKGTGAMQRLLKMAERATGGQLLRLIRDAHRFILSYRQIIETMPLQVYKSALLFSPANSLVRSTYEDRSPHWMKLKPAVDLDWNACLQTLDGHQGWVMCVAFSPDGNLLASASADKSIMIWDPETGACFHTLEGHRDCVSAVVFSADGTRLASASHDNTVRIWETNGTCIRIIEGHSDMVASVAFSPDGRRLASASYDKTIRIWDNEKGACIRILKGHDDTVFSVAFSPDGKRLASASEDETARMWNIETGACIYVFEGYKGALYSVAFSPDARRLALASCDESVRIWDEKIGICSAVLEGHSGAVTSVKFSPDGKRIASSSVDQTAKIWDLETGACSDTLRNHGHEVQSVAFSSDGKWLASASCDNTVRVWDCDLLKVGTGPHELQDHSGSAGPVAFSPDGTKVLSASSDGTMKIWGFQTAACCRTLEGHDDILCHAAFSPSGSMIVSASGDKTVKIWDSDSGACLRTLEGHGDFVFSVAFSPDESKIVSAAGDSIVKIWDSESGACLRTLEGHEDAVCSAVFSPDGSKIASASDDQTVKIWDDESGVCLHTLESDGAGEYSVRFSPDGRELALETTSGTARVWDSTTGDHTRTSEGHYITDRPLIFTKGKEQSCTLGAKSKIYSYDSLAGRVLEDGETLFYIPQDYSVSGVDVMGSKLAIGCGTGRVLMMEFA